MWVSRKQWETVNNRLEYLETQSILIPDHLLGSKLRRPVKIKHLLRSFCSIFKVRYVSRSEDDGFVGDSLIFEPPVEKTTKETE